MINRIVSGIMSVIILVSSLITGVIPVSEKLRIVVPEDCELCVGDSRTLECVFSEKVTERALEWSVEPSGVASVDKWGRVTALSEGKATVTAKGNGFSDSVELNVVLTPTLADVNKNSKITYTNGISETENLQKLVSRFTHGNPEIPDYVSSVKDYSAHQSAVTVDGAVWEITDYGVLRTNKNASNPNRDDVAQLDLSKITPQLRETLTYNLKTSDELPALADNPEIIDIVKYVLAISKLDWTVAAPDERMLYKYNTSSYFLDGYVRTNCMQPSTTYTLPYWMGVYHGIIEQ